MSNLSAAADAHIDARPEVVLAILRDLDGHHRRILPPAFSDFEVLHGGQGDGTLSRFKFRLGGKTTEERTLTTETNPGVIREQVLGRDMVTEFRVVGEGGGSRVSIATTWTARNAVVRVLERLVVKPMLRRVYVQELELLAGYAPSVASVPTPPAAASIPTSR
jgi:hypothetical protein